VSHREEWHLQKLFEGGIVLERLCDSKNTSVSDDVVGKAGAAE
jgi:hypothetical protein